MRLICPSCNYTDDVDDNGFPPGTRRVSCPRCDTVFDLPIEDTGVEVEPSSGPEPETTFEPAPERTVPWERRREFGFWRSIVATVGQVLFSPGAFFTKMDRTGGIKDPLLFSLIVGTAGIAASMLWGALFVRIGLVTLPPQLTPSAALKFNLFLVALSPPAIVFSTFALSGLFHFFLGLLIPNRDRFEATFRVVAYANAIYAAALIPLFAFDSLSASMVLTLLNLIIIVIGLARVHQATGLRVATGVMLAIWVLIGAIAMVGMLFGAAGMNFLR